MHVEHVNERARQQSLGEGNSSSGSLGNEGRPTSPVIHRDEVIARSLLTAYGDIARRIGELGYAAISVTEAEEQLLGTGEPLTNPKLVVVTFTGREQDWEDFWEVAYGVSPILDPFTGVRPFHGEEETAAVEAAIQKRLDSVASKHKMRDQLFRSLGIPKAKG